MTCIFLRTAIISSRSSVREVDALEQDLAAGRVVEPQHQAAERRLSAARLADQAQRLAALDVERDVVDGAHQLAARAGSRCATGKIFLACRDVEDGVGVAGRSTPAPWPTSPPVARRADRAPRSPLRDGRQRGGPARPPRAAGSSQALLDGERGSAGGSGSPTAGRADWAARRRWSRAWRCGRDRAAARRASRPRA